MTQDTLRVLYSFPHPVGSPGIGTTALNQVRALASAGADVTLVCTSLHEHVPSSVDVRQTLTIAGRRVPHRAFGSPDTALAYHDLRVERFLRRSPGRFDVVHTWPQSAERTLRAAREAGCVGSREVPNAHTAEAYEQALLESHLVGIEMPRGHSHSPDSRRLALEEREYADADVLLVPSEHVRQSFLGRGIDPKKLKLHQYGYDTTRFSALGRSDWPARPFTVAFVGSGEPRKGLHYALDAWRSLDPPGDARFLVAGAMSPGYRAFIEKTLALPSVQELGFVQDVPALLRESDVLVLPSVEEGSALVTYEAQASGCIPLVSSAAGARVPPTLHEYIHEPRDVAALGRHLRTLCDDPEMRARLRSDVVAWSTGLTWEAAGRRMLEIFAQAVDSRQASPA